MSKDKYMSIYKRQTEVIVFMILEIFSQSAGKMNDLLFPAWDVRVFCILWYNFKKKQTCPFICNRRVTLFHLKFYFKRTLIALDGGFENWGLSVGCILGYSLVSTKAYSITRSI